MYIPCSRIGVLPAEVNRGDFLEIGAGLFHHLSPLLLQGVILEIIIPIEGVVYDIDRR